MICLHTRLWRPARQRGATRPMMPETTTTRKYGNTRVAPVNDRATAAPASSALQAYRISTALRCEWPISSRRWWRCRLSAVAIPLLVLALPPPHREQRVDQRQGQHQQRDRDRDQQGELVRRLRLGGAADAGDGRSRQQRAEQHRA